MLPIKQILHPTDFSQPSEYALRFACSLARDYDAGLLLLHVVEPPVYYGELGMTMPLPVDFHDNLREKLVRMVNPKAGIPIETILTEGNAAKEILRVAEERDCHLIILGTHGRTGLSRVLLGSVAEDVIRHSRIPVLTLKTPTTLDVATETEAAAPGASEGEAMVGGPTANAAGSRSVIVL